MTPTPYSITELEDQERELVLASFTNEDAWRIGATIVQHAIRQRLPVAVDLRRTDDCLLFRAALTGTTADQETWIARKSATTLRFEASSLLVGLRMSDSQHDPFASSWLDPTRYTLAGGSFPVRVASAGVVGAITVSGLSSQEDHDLIVDTLRQDRTPT